MVAEPLFVQNHIIVIVTPRAPRICRLIGRRTIHDLLRSVPRADSPLPVGVAVMASRAV